MPPKAAKTTAPKPEAAPKPKKPRVEQTGRPVVYPQLESRIYTTAPGGTHGNLTRAIMKEIVGYVEDSEATPFGDDYLYKLPCSGKKVRWTNNDHNRDFQDSWAGTLGQEILNCRFAPKGPNGEAVIVGKTGVITSAQHRLAGLDMACDRWESETEGKHWKKLWPEEPYIETFASFGTDESIETFQTLDHTRPRNFADVLFSDPEVFGKRVTPANRKAFARNADYTIRELWHRTGLDANAFSPRRTPSEMGDFLRRHDRLKEMVKHVHGENKDNVLSKVLSPGKLTGFAYLMGVSATDPEKYLKHDEPSERQLDFSRWEKAEEFVTVLASGAGADLGSVWDKLASMVNGEAKASTGERIAVLTKAWLLFCEGKPVTLDDLGLEYANDSLINVPAIGGIDKGEPNDNDADKDEGSVTPEQVADEKAKVDDEHLTAKQANKKAEALTKKLAYHRGDHPDKTLVFHDVTGPYQLFAEDAILSAKVLHAPLAKVHGTEIDAVDIEPQHLESAVRKLTRAGHALILLQKGEDGFVTPSELKAKPVTPGGK